MNDPTFERPSYFAGQRLLGDDLEAEQTYQLARLREHVGALLGRGVLLGLAVEPSPGGGGVDVAPGVAIDGRGRRVVVPTAVSMDVPSGAPETRILVLRYREDEVDDVGYESRIVETFTLAWIAGNSPPDDEDGVPLAVVRASTSNPLDTSVRRDCVLSVGRVELLAPTEPSTRGATLVAWKAGEAGGLRVDSAGVDFDAVGDEGHDVVVASGAVGVGTLAPGATLDVVGRLGARTPGLAAGPGAVVAKHGSAGASARATVGSADLVRPLLVARFAGAGSGVVALCADGRVGVGTETPGARLTVVGGDVSLDAGDRRIAFARGGRLCRSSGADDHLDRVVFDPDRRTLEVRVHADLAIGNSKDRAELFLGKSQNVGVGTESPQALLDVAGFLDVRSGGLVFPDGTVQTSAEVSIPIGTILDWWRGNVADPLPSAYVVCDGQTVKDEESPFHGTAVPNLAHHFLLGSTDPAVVMGPQPPQTPHVHTYPAPIHTHTFAHTHPDIAGTTSPSDDSTGPTQGGAYARESHVHDFTAKVLEPSTAITGPNDDAGKETSTAGTELLPPFIGLLKIIRIK